MNSPTGALRLRTTRQSTSGASCCAPGDTRLIDKNANGRPLLCGGELGSNSLLDLHCFAIPAVLDSGWQLIRHPGGTRTLLLRIAKNAEPLEASRLDKINQSAEVFLAFHREIRR